MANKHEYTDRLTLAIEESHRCRATWRKTVPVHEVYNGQTVWQGEVEVFELRNHPEAKNCYGWTQGDPEELISILEIHPVNSAQTAVKTALAYQHRKARR